MATKSTKITKTPAKKADTPAEVVEAAVAAGKETVEAAVKVGTDAATKSVEKAAAMSQEHVEATKKAGAEAFKGYEDMVSASKAHVDAVLKSNQILVKGAQDVNKLLLGLAEASLHDGVAATKKMFACKSVQDVVSVQNDLARANYKKIVDEGRKLSDLSTKVAEEAVEPITTVVSKSVEQFSKPLAA